MHIVGNHYVKHTHVVTPRSHSSSHQTLRSPWLMTETQRPRDAAFETRPQCAGPARRGRHLSVDGARLDPREIPPEISGCWWSRAGHGQATNGVSCYLKWPGDTRRELLPEPKKYGRDRFSIVSEPYVSPYAQLSLALTLTAPSLAPI